MEYRAYIQSTGDALLAFEAALSGSAYVHRVTRRWNYQERISHIRSGTIFVFNELESNVKRWTDGRMWTPSRILKNFLVYREKYAADEVRPRNGSLGGRYPTWLVGAIDGPEVRAGGLVKKTIPIVVEGTRYSLVSYYDPEDVLSGRLVRPCNFSGLSSLIIRPSILACRGMRERVRIFVNSEGHRRPIMEEDEIVSMQDLAALMRLPASPNSNPYDYSSDEEPDSPTSTLRAFSDYADTVTSEFYAPTARGYATRSPSPRCTGMAAFERAANSRSPMQLRRPRQRVRFSPYYSPSDAQSQQSHSLPASPVASSFDLHHSHSPGLTRSYSDSYLEIHIKREPEFVHTQPEEAPVYLETKSEQVFLSDTMSAITPEMPRLAPGPVAPLSPPRQLEPSTAGDFFYTGQFWMSPIADPGFATHWQEPQDLYSTAGTAGWDTTDALPDPLFFPFQQE